MKLVTIVILYSKENERQFMHSGSFAVSSDEEVRASFWALAEPLIADGLTIRDQLFIVAPDELIQQVIDARGIPEPKEPDPPKRAYFGQHQSEVPIESQEQR